MKQNQTYYQINTELKSNKLLYQNWAKSNQIKTELKSNENLTENNQNWNEFKHIIIYQSNQNKLKIEQIIKSNQSHYEIKLKTNHQIEIEMIKNLLLSSPSQRLTLSKVVLLLIS